MISIRTKLSLWISGLVIASTVVGLFIFESLLRIAFHDSIINRLEEDLQQVVHSTHLHKGEVSIDPSQLSEFYNPTYSGRYYQLNLAEDTLRSASLWDRQLKIKPLSLGQTRAWQAKGPLNHDMQLLSIGLASETEQITGTLTVAQDLSIGRQLFTEVYGTKLIVNVLMLIAMVTGVFLVLRQSFKPITQVQDSLAKLREGEINSLDVSIIPPEIRPLADTYNELLDYTSAQIARSRNNLGNLSHGLKTPLAVMQQQVEALGLSDPEAAIAMQQQLDLIHKMVERKLAAARVTGDLLPAAQLSIPKDIQSLCNTLEKINMHKQISHGIEIDGDIVRLPIHREDGMELIGNLLDNAFKWAKGQVNVNVWQDDDKLSLSVTDDGPGVSQDQLAELTQRGKRLDETVSGHGLGLSIVKDIAEQYELPLHFYNSEALSGLTVRLDFPSK